jgi:hypothetical protein
MDLKDNYVKALNWVSGPRLPPDGLIT